MPKPCGGGFLTSLPKPALVAQAGEVIGWGAGWDSLFHLILGWDSLFHLIFNRALCIFISC